MSNLNIHPAPGFGDLTAGFYVVPQNPIRRAQEGISKVPALGDFMAACFAVPQNPVLDYAVGQVKPLGQGAGAMPGLHNVNSGSKGMGSMGCGCGGGCGGMGTLSTDIAAFTADLTAGNFTQALTTDTIGGVPTWGWLAGLALFYMSFVGGGKHSRVSRARRAYSAYAA